MRNTFRSSTCATAAIAAALALSATPAFAQDAAGAPLDGPIINIPPVTATQSVPQPTTPAPIVLPDVSAVPSSPATTTTTVTPKPAPATPTTARTAAPAAPVQRAAPAVAAETTRSAPADAESTVTATPVVAEETASSSEAAPVFAPVNAAPVESDIAPTPEQTADVTGILALALIGLVGMGLAGFALLAFRRRPRKAYRPAPVIEKPVAASRPSPAAFAPAAPAYAAPAYSAPSRDSVIPESNGGSVPLPRELPESFEERDSLLKRMVAARPDRANPFTSYKARVHRARLILQSLGRRFERARPWIDLSEYPRNWPSLARTRNYQTA